MEAERRTRDTVGERTAKRIKLLLADRRVNPACSSSAHPASSLHGVMLQLPAMLLLGVAQDAGNVVAKGVAQDRLETT